MPPKPTESESRIKRQKIPFLTVRDPVRESGPESSAPSGKKGVTAISGLRRSAETIISSIWQTKNGSKTESVCRIPWKTKLGRISAGVNTAQDVTRMLVREAPGEEALVALREAIANSLVHADYALKGSPVRFAIFINRIEIENPGLLVAGLTTMDMQRGISKLRNRVVGRVFHELGLIEQWGSGIQRMNQECQNAGFTSPVLEELGQSFRVTFSRTRSTPSVRDAKDSKILEIVKTTPGLTTARIAKQIKLTPRSTRDRLSKLVEAGILSVVGTGLRDPKRAFYPTQQ